MRPSARKRALPPTLLAAVFTIAAAAGAAPLRPALSGEWGASQIRLALTATGGTIDFDCASARLDTPVHPDAGGNFTANARYEAYAPGPTRAADAPPATVPARIIGRVDGSTLHLSVRTKGDTAAHDYTLERGRRVKIIRCL